MATAADLIGQCNEKIGAVQNELTALRAEFDASKAADLSERLARLEAAVDELRRTRDRFESRSWQLAMLVVGGVVTLAINLAVSFLRK